VGDQFASIELSSISFGITLRTPIYKDSTDDNLTLLLATGTVVTESLLSRLGSRGISRVLVHRDEAGRIQGRPKKDARQAIERATSQIHLPANSRWTCSTDSIVHKIATHGATPYDAVNLQRFAKKFDASLRQVEQLFDGLSQGDVNLAAPLAAVSSESLMRIADDLDLFISMGLTPATDKYPYKHSLQTAMLAMAVGTILGLKPDELIELGIGCLVHDTGMLKLNPELVNANRPLTKIEFLEITKHPTLTFDALRDAKGVPNGSRLVAYQMHERLDGSGYPRRRTANQIHYLAKIAAVADVFVALVSPRPYRSELLHYHAMEQILHGARKGLFDTTVVRALLHTVSLFPIGSYVEISDGRVGKVVRSNRDAYTSPIIEIRGAVGSADAPECPLEIIDLREDRELTIVRVVTDAPTSLGKS
jgi:HD-GYP domain-containing protein (c-di-GMP phosphodiesterase class II)